MTDEQRFRELWRQFAAAGFALYDHWLSPTIQPSGEPVIDNDEYTRLFGMDFGEWLHELMGMIRENHQ
jgi:hypothetical protein